MKHEFTKRDFKVWLRLKGINPDDFSNDSWEAIRLFILLELFRKEHEEKLRKHFETLSTEELEEIISSRRKTK